MLAGEMLSGHGLSCAVACSAGRSYLLVIRFSRQIKFAVGTDILYIAKCSQVCFLVVLLG